MRFITCIAGFLAASTIVAMPVANGPIAVTAPAIVERSCGTGVPCVVQAEVQNALSFVTNAINILKGPIDKVIAAVNSAASALAAVAVELKADVANLAADAAAELEAEVVAAIKSLVQDIRNDLNTIKGGVAEVTADLQAAIDAVNAAIKAIEDVVGPC